MKRMMTGVRRLTGAVAFAALLTGAAQAQDADLSVFDWSGYEDPALNPDYVAKHGDSPTFSFFADEDEAFEKLRAGFKADISHPCGTNIVKWRDAGLLQPLDVSKIAAWNDIMPGFRNIKDLMTDADGKAWFLPFDWGNTLPLYRTDMIKPEDIASVKAFADPRFKGKIALIDNADASFALGLIAAGIKDVQNVTDAQFEAAAAFLREVHKNVRMYATDNTELSQAFASGEISLAWAWNETATMLKANGVAVDVNRDVGEGIASWVCGYVHLKDAPGSADKAYDFFNARMAPDVSNYMVTAWGYGHANGAGMAKVDPVAVAAAGYADIDEMTKKTLFAAPVAPETKQRFIAEFEKIKSGY
jgi:spermidine/putrescine transport system substrate-binding protein